MPWVGRCLRAMGRCLRAIGRCLRAIGCHWVPFVPYLVHLVICAIFGAFGPFYPFTRSSLVDPLPDQAWWTLLPILMNLDPVLTDFDEFGPFSRFWTLPFFGPAPNKPGFPSILVYFLYFMIKCRKCHFLTLLI